MTELERQAAFCVGSKADMPKSAMNIARSHLQVSLIASTNSLILREFSLFGLHGKFGGNAHNDCLRELWCSEILPPMGEIPCSFPC